LSGSQYRHLQNAGDLTRRGSASREIAAAKMLPAALMVLVFALHAVRNMCGILAFVYRLFPRVEKVNGLDG
jgi:hypothetical protein